MGCCYRPKRMKHQRIRVQSVSRALDERGDPIEPHDRECASSYTFRLLSKDHEASRTAPDGVLPHAPRYSTTNTKRNINNTVFSRPRSNAEHESRDIMVSGLVKSIIIDNIVIPARLQAFIPTLLHTNIPSRTPTVGETSASC